MARTPYSSRHPYGHDRYPDGPDVDEDDGDVQEAITASDILDAITNDGCQRLARLAWDIANDSSDGFDAEGGDFGELVLAATTDSELTVYNDDGDAVLVSVDGWAVRVSAT